jgi:hypothetical protein
MGEVTRVPSETDNRPNPGQPKHPDPGLCGDCQHAHRIESDRGAIFIRCELSFQGSKFPKYPRLPVLACSGYRPY